MPKPITADLPAGEVIARLTGIDDIDAWHAAQPWLLGRVPLQAAREILAAAATATPSERIAAVELIEALGEPAHVAWRDVVAAPNLAAYARINLTEWSEQQTPSPEDLAWLAVDYTVAALTDSGPDEALSASPSGYPARTSTLGWV